VILGWCLAQAGLNALQAGLSAVVPDQVPVAQRGAVSGWIGLPQSVVVLLAVVLVMAMAAVLLALWPSWPAAMAAAAIMGLGFGVYLSVDAALVTQVLPSAAGRAKDLGLINIANSGPQVLAPAIAAPLVSQLGGYPFLYLTVAAVTVFGSLSVQRIRGARARVRSPSRSPTAE